MKLDRMGRPVRDRQHDAKSRGAEPPEDIGRRFRAVPELLLTIPDHLCQLCERELASWGGSRDGLCADCEGLLAEEDHQAWVMAGGRTCRRCRQDLLPSALVDGLCPCGGAPW